jgi:hypothetical protein
MMLVTLMIEGIRSSETLVPTRATWLKIPEEGILQNYNKYSVCMDMKL